MFQMQWSLAAFLGIVLCCWVCNEQKKIISLHVKKEATLSIITQWRSSERQVVIHKLTPCDNHDSAGVIVISLVGVNGARNDARWWQVMASDGDTRRVDAVAVEWSDQTLEWRHRGAPCWVLEIVAETVDAAIFAWTALDARKERRADFANERFRGVNLWQAFLNVFVAQTVTVNNMNTFFF
jgi:hypothetical protein